MAKTDHDPLAELPDLAYRANRLRKENVALALLVREVAECRALLHAIDSGNLAARLAGAHVHSDEPPAAPPEVTVASLPDLDVDAERRKLMAIVAEAFGEAEEHHTRITNEVRALRNIVRSLADKMADQGFTHYEEKIKAQAERYAAHVATLHAKLSSYSSPGATSSPGDTPGAPALGPSGSPVGEPPSGM